jgi:hypothetical protein
MSLLVFTWAINLGMQAAPFRFPAAVIAAFSLFVFLLLLDWLSSRFPGARQDDAEQQSEKPQRRSKRFIEPCMKLLAPPCDFCLRNMSVMFTPSFVLIPAREIIDGKEIGLIIGWFAATQILAFVLPVYFTRGINWLWTLPEDLKARRQAAKWEAKRKEIVRSRRNSAVEASRRGSTATMHDAARRGSTATLAGLEFEKGVAFSGGSRLGAVASGLAGITATVTAPVAHVNMAIEEDEQRHMDAVIMEQARQQGEPFVTSADSAMSFGNFSPRSDVSYFSHPHHRHHHHHDREGRREHRDGEPRSARSRSRTRDSRRPGSASRPSSAGRPVSAGRPGSAGEAHSARPSTLSRAGTSFLGNIKRPGSSGSGKRPGSSGADGEPDMVDKQTPALPSSVAQSSLAPTSGRFSSAEYRFPSPLPTPQMPSMASVAFELHLPTAASFRRAENGPSEIDVVREESTSPSASATTTANNSRRQSLMYSNGEALDRRGWEMSSGAATLYALDSKHSANKLALQKSNVEQQPADNHDDAASECSDDEEDAVERLASWFGDLITPAFYFLVFLIGIPLWFAADIALPLFLGINLLTFLAAITIVPPKIRRFLHPILSTSLATVLIIWAFGAMRGLSIKETLAYYSRDAKYTVLWSLQGYSGPIPGAGDILFSTLDAGVVSLAVPMYRYRKDLKANFWRMLCALLPCAALSLFVWPYLAYLMGMNRVHSLAFAARFMSTPLAIELATNIGADQSITVILVVVTGVIYAIVKEPVFRWLRVTDDMVVGITMGSTAGAIGASSLISKPRQLALASLCFIM